MVAASDIARGLNKLINGNEMAAQSALFDALPDGAAVGFEPHISDMTAETCAARLVWICGLHVHEPAD